MANYKIITDASCDLDPKMAESLGVFITPMTITIDGKVYKNYADGMGDVSFSDFYNLLRAGKASTSTALNVGEATEAMEPFLKSGQDVIFIALSSGLSNSYNATEMAAQELREKYPDRKIYAVDSLSGSVGEGLMVYQATKLKEGGATIDEVNDWLIENRPRLAGWFTVDDLNHLKRGGRVSAAAALFGTMVGIKPVLRVDEEGKLMPVTKVRGRKASITALADKVGELGTDFENMSVFISHGDCYDETFALGEELKARYGVKEVYINYIGGLIGTHTGPGAIAMFFFGTGR